MNWDISSLPLGVRREVHEILTKDYQLNVLKAIREQTRMKALDELENRRSMDGLGGRKFQVHQFIDAIWRRVYGHNYSHDPDLMKFLGKRNPEITTRIRGTKLMVGYMPSASASRFHKVY